MLHIDLVLLAFSDNPVRIFHQALLDDEANVGEPVGLPLGQATHAAKRMEGDDKRRAERLLDALRNHAGHEKIGMDKVVANFLAACKTEHEAGKFFHVRQHHFLRDKVRRTGWYINDAHAGQPVDDQGLINRIASGKNINLPSQLGKLSCQMCDIHVLSAAIDASHEREW